MENKHEKGRGLGVRIESLSNDEITAVTYAGENVCWLAGSKDHDNESIFFTEAHLGPLINALEECKKMFDEWRGGFQLPLESKVFWDGEKVVDYRDEE